jgi:hypothetical protein
MGRGESDQTNACAPDDEASALTESGGLATESPSRLLSRMLVELQDPESGFAETIGSTYAIEAESASGALHILFRLKNGNENEPEVVAVYFGGRAVEDIDPTVVEQIVTATCEESPGLFWENY